MNVQSIFVCDSPKLKTQMSIYRWVDKQTVVYGPNGILPSNKKESTTDTFNNRDESPKNYAELKKQTKKSMYCMSSFI